MKQKTAFDWQDEPSIYFRDAQLRRHVLSVQSVNTRKAVEDNLALKKSIAIYSLAKDKKETR
jgi:hypothetical protein